MFNPTISVALSLLIQKNLQTNIHLNRSNDTTMKLYDDPYNSDDLQKKIGGFQLPTAHDLFRNLVDSRRRNLAAQLIRHHLQTHIRCTLFLADVDHRDWSLPGGATTILLGRYNDRCRPLSADLRSDPLSRIDRECHLPVGADHDRRGYPTSTSQALNVSRRLPPFAE